MEATPYDATANLSPRYRGRFKAIIAMGAGVSMLLPIYGVSAQSVELPDGPGKSVVMDNCTACHGSEVITAKRRSTEEWSQVVNRMMSNGAALTDDQQATVLTYLKTYLATPAVSGSTPAPGSNTKSK